jgi:hypothetical protein
MVWCRPLLPPLFPNFRQPMDGEPRRIHRRQLTDNSASVAHRPLKGRRRSRPSVMQRRRIGHGRRAGAGTEAT